MFITCKLEDTILVAEYHEDQDIQGEEDQPHRPSMWHVSVTDTFSKQVKTAKWTALQMSAVMALAVSGGEEFDVEITDYLYAICKPLFEGWSNEIRPIP